MTAMRYLHATSHAMCGDTFRRLLPEFHDTPLARVLAEHFGNDTSAMANAATAA